MNEVQKSLLDMMIDLDAVLRENGIDYYLDGGTAIGAVRHKGFIPWDDDIDISIHQKDEKKLIEAFSDNKHKNYFLQKPFSIDWPYGIYKLRKNGTTAIEEKFVNSRMHQGLFIDIYVLYDYPDGFVRRKLLNSTMFVNHIIQTVYEKLIGKKILRLYEKPSFFLLKTNEKILKALPEKDCKNYFANMCWYKNYIKEKRFFEETVDIEFENHQFEATPLIDEMLRAEYGDYMVLPPESERVGEHIAYFSNTEDYTEYLKRRKC